MDRPTEDVDKKIHDLDVKNAEELRQQLTLLIHASSQQRRDTKRTGKPEGAFEISYRVTSDWTPDEEFISYVDATDSRIYHVYASDFWQSKQSVETPFWPTRALPERFTSTGGKRHPVRAVKPAPGTILYKRYCPTFDAYFTLRTADLDTDLAAFHTWHNEDRVDAFWGERGDLAHHEAYLRRQMADPHVLPVFATFHPNDEEGQGRPFAYFELYHCAEDGISTYASFEGHDRGFHAVVGGTDKTMRGPERVRLWIACCTHYLFLADARTTRVVLEPRVDNAVFLAYLQRAGYAYSGEIEFPHKRAALMTITREKFFASQVVET